MPLRVRIASLNLRATPNRSPERLVPLFELLALASPDLVLLQECRTGWLELLCAHSGLQGLRSNELTPDIVGLPRDGVAIAVKPPLSITKAAPIPPGMFDPASVSSLAQDPAPQGYDEIPPELAARFSARSLMAEISDGSDTFIACSLHATPGTGRYGAKPGKLVNNWKPFFHGGAALALSQLTIPFVFAIDANEPRSETFESVSFHWREGRPGALMFAALLGLEPKHRARDLLREQLLATGSPAASDTYLAQTYATHNGGPMGGRRFDSIWASPEFRLKDITIRYQEALAAGTDHALLIADTTLRPAAQEERTGYPGQADAHRPEHGP